jgi:hypothetical protein
LTSGKMPKAESMRRLTVWFFSVPWSAPSNIVCLWLGKHAQSSSS